MALVPATIDLSFTSQYTSGCHRLGYRIQGSGDPYTIQAVACTPFIIPNPPPTCLAQINIMVDDETCDAVVYEGYVQPCCQTEESLNGRVPFTVTFTPNPTCKSYQLTCDSTGILEVLVTTSGTGYTPGATVPVTFADPAGTLADFECYVEDDGVEAISFPPAIAAVIADGTYTTAGINAVVAGTPTPGTFEITVVASVITAIVPTPPTGLTPTSYGVGYTVGDTITFAAPFNLMTVTVTNVYNGGEIFVCVPIAPGSGYTGPTTATIPAPGAGITALLEVKYALCNPTEYFGTGCDDDVTPLRPDVALGATVQICRKGDVGTAPANMTIVAGGCCADQGCETVTISAVDPNYDGNIWYVDCCSKITQSPTTKEGGGIDPNDLPIIMNYMIGSLVFDPPGSEALLTISAPVPYTCP